MEVVILLLLIAGAICFGLAAAAVATRINLVALGLLLWVITVIVPAARAV